jgi:hypothetical protein
MHLFDKFMKNGQWSHESASTMHNSVNTQVEEHRMLTLSRLNTSLVASGNNRLNKTVTSAYCLRYSLSFKRCLITVSHPFWDYKQISSRIITHEFSQSKQMDNSGAVPVFLQV